jgi:hypothetical protein
MNAESSRNSKNVVGNPHSAVNKKYVNRPKIFKKVVEIVDSDVFAEELVT